MTKGACIVDFYQVTAAFYDRTFGRAELEGERGDVAFYVEEARQAGSPVLELACGTGRVLIPVAEAGLTVVGLDSSAAMLSIAQEKIAKLPDATQQRIELVEGDMRSFALDQRFKLIMIPFRSFLHLMTPADQRQALGCIRDHLADDGRLVFNIFDPRLDTIAAHLGPLGAALKRFRELTHPETGRRVVVWEARHYDPAQQVIEEERIFEELDADGRVVAKTYAPLTLRWVYRYEMQHLLELSGFCGRGAVRQLRARTIPTWRRANLGGAEGVAGLTPRPPLHMVERGCGDRHSHASGKTPSPRGRGPG